MNHSLMGLCYIEAVPEIRWIPRLGTEGYLVE